MFTILSLMSQNKKISGHLPPVDRQRLANWVIIHINDFPNASKLFQFIMYADDTTLICCVDTIQ